MKCDMCHKKKKRVKDTGMLNEMIGENIFVRGKGICNDCLRWVIRTRKANK